ncbi:MAG: hypothetical protein U0805_00545 [Pirellulales bacterium]
MTTSTRSPSAAAGLSTLEFLGCLTAVIGGAWIGAIYLGVDVKKVAYTALSESQLLDKVPEEWRPEDPQEKAMTRDQLLATLREELGSLRHQISSLRTGRGESDGEDAAADASGAAQLPTKERTLAYWSRLNEISLGEADLQREAEAAVSAENAAKVFVIKGRICRFAAKAVEAIPSQAVDEEALWFGRQLQLWYDKGGELYERAVRIWETPVGAQARTQLNGEWKQADEHHRNEAKLVNQKATAVRGTVSRIYGVEFPEFGKPATGSENKDSNNKSA